VSASLALAVCTRRCARGEDERLPPLCV